MYIVDRYKQDVDNSIQDLAFRICLRAPQKSHKIIVCSMQQFIPQNRKKNTIPCRLNKNGTGD